jgi:hypothetical protein
MCLHPPQAYNLGRFIGRFGTTRESATFVATHSSHVLRGVIQTAEHVQIVRLTRLDRVFSAHLVSAVDLSEALSRPTLRSEAILDGIFARAVVVVEADGDRLVYQAVWETLHDDFRIDLHFSTVGGTDGIADTCSLYRSLEIPIAVIADLDILVDGERMSRVLTKLVDDSEDRNALLQSCNKVAEAVRNLPPTIEPSEISKELLSILEGRMNWSQRDDVELRRRLGRLGNDMDRMRRLKRGGIEAYSGDLRQEMSDIAERLKGHGLFLVPVGELEQWLATENVGVSTSDKRAWSNAAAQTVQKAGKRDDDVWGFMAAVGRYLSSGEMVPSSAASNAEGTISPVS